VKPRTINGLCAVTAMLLSYACSKGKAAVISGVPPYLPIYLNRTIRSWVFHGTLLFFVLANFTSSRRWLAKSRIAVAVSYSFIFLPVRSTRWPVGGSLQFWMSGGTADQRYRSSFAFKIREKKAGRH
jgi:hypothetical protein